MDEDVFSPGFCANKSLKAEGRTYVTFVGDQGGRS